MSKILLIDDDADLAELIKTKLVAEGHDVTTANTGEGAFELAKKVKPEIALLDIMLPGVTGYQICRKIRRDPELYPIGVLMLTALGEEPEVAHGLEQGADDYIVKPFKLERLIEKLGHLRGMLEQTGQKHRVTNMPGTEAIKREINHQLARGGDLAVCYLDMLNFKPYCAAKGPEGQVRALEMMTKTINSIVRSIGIYESFQAHMGGEHFVVMLNYDDYERFANTMIETFDRNVRELYTPDELAKGYITARDRRGREGKYPIMTLAIGVAHNQHREYRNANKVFETLAQLRQRTKSAEKSLIVVDRRTADR